MDELRIVNKKKVTKKTVTSLLKVGHPARNIYNPRVFNCKLFSTLRGHQGDVLSLTITENKIISGSQDKTIKIWDLNTAKLLHTLSGHNSGIYSLAVSNNRLVSSSADRTIKIWDLNSNELMVTLLGHNSHVYSLSASNDKFASASLDKTIKIWDFETKKIYKIIQTGESSALSICIYNDKLIGGLGDGTIKIWEINSGRLLTSYQENNESITSVCVSNGVIISGSKDKTIRIWDLETLELINTLYGHKAPVWTVTVDTGIIISGSDDKTVKLWNLGNGSLIETLKGHTDWVSCVAARESSILSASGDSTINIWTKIPVHNCNSIDFSGQVEERSPFDTDKDFAQKQQNILWQFYNKLDGYDYINIGKVELLGDEYTYENNIFPVKINISCEKVLKFSKLSKSSFSSIVIDHLSAEQIFKNSRFQDLYIRYFLDNQVLKYELSVIYGCHKYNIDLKLVVPDKNEPPKKDLKTDRLKISKGKSELTKITFNEQLTHDCNTIDTTDTFKSPFEANEDFGKRIRIKLINYRHINIGKVELIAEQYDIGKSIFPMKIFITCDKILNISDLEKHFRANIIIDRYQAKDLYEKSKSHPLFINFYEIGNILYYDLSIIFQNIKYFIN